MFLNILQNLRKNTCVRVSLLINCTPEACSFTKNETPTQVFYREYYEIFIFTDFRNSKSAILEIFEFLRCLFHVFRENGIHFSFFRNKTNAVVVYLNAYLVEYLRMTASL